MAEHELTRPCRGQLPVRLIAPMVAFDRAPLGAPNAGTEAPTPGLQGIMDRRSREFKGRPESGERNLKYRADAAYGLAEKRLVHP